MTASASSASCARPVCRSSTRSRAGSRFGECVSSAELQAITDLTLRQITSLFGMPGFRHALPGGAGRDRSQKSRPPTPILQPGVRSCYSLRSNISYTRPKARVEVSSYHEEVRPVGACGAPEALANVAHQRFELRDCFSSFTRDLANCAPRRDYGLPAKIAGSRYLRTLMRLLRLGTIPPGTPPPPSPKHVPSKKARDSEEARRSGSSSCNAAAPPRPARPMTTSR